MQNKLMQIIKEYPNTLYLALPIIGTQLAYVGMEIVDTVMIGHLGRYQLASAALSGVTYFSVLVFFIGLLSSCGVLIARDVGSNKLDSIPLHLYQAIILSLFCSFPAILIIWMLPKIFLYINQDLQIVYYSTQYLHAVVWGVPAFLLYIALREFITAMFLPKVVMWIAVMAIPANAILNYIFIYGKLGMPAMGIAGAGYATVLINWLMFAALFLYILCSEKFRSYIINVVHATINIRILKAMLRIGGPIGITMLFEVGLFAVVGILMGYFGVDALAAHQVALKACSTAFMIMFGFSQAAAVRISHAIGANRKNHVRVLGYSALHLGLFTALITACIMLVFPEAIANIFFDSDAVHNKEVLILTTRFLQIAAIFQFPDAIQVIMNGSLKGMKDTFMPMIIGLVSYWVVGITAGLIASQYYGLNGSGLWVGLTVGLSVSALLLWYRFVHKSKEVMIIS